jgi:two-component system, OmpR family, sensor kinase
VLAVVSLGVPLASSLSERVNAEVHSQALSEADVLAATSADLLQPVRTQQLEALTRAGASAVRGRVLIVNAGGKVLADSGGRATVGHSYRSRPEIAVALRGSSIQAQRASRSLGENILATAVPVLRRGQAVGAVRITQSVAAVRKAIRGTIVKLVLVAAVVLALGLLAGGLIARQTAMPLARLEGTARRLADGELSARAHVEGSSEQRSLSRSFNDMADRLSRLITAQREFVADASHQLRTPLTALRLRLEEARAAGVGGALTTQLDAGLAEVDRLADIVEELLLLSRAEDRELEGERVDLRETASRAATRWRAAAHACGITIDLAADGRGSAWCAQRDLDRALDALIENALQYASAGGELALAFGPGWIEVRDRGPGLEEGEQALLFERFHRGGAGRRGPAGSGLGLPIARTLARAWGGEARIANRPEGGAVARLDLAEREP